MFAPVMVPPAMSVPVMVPSMMFPVATEFAASFAFVTLPSWMLAVTTGKTWIHPASVPSVFTVSTFVSLRYASIPSRTTDTFSEASRPAAFANLITA